MKAAAPRIWKPRSPTARGEQRASSSSFRLSKYRSGDLKERCGPKINEHRPPIPIGFSKDRITSLRNLPPLVKALIVPSPQLPIGKSLLKTDRR
jgi:hypothetical protein